MTLRRGDVLKARFPHASGGRGKKRPVVVQADDYNQRLHHAVVAQVTTNLDEKDDPACLFVEAATPEGKAAGLDRDCLICCTLLSLMTEDRLREKVGSLSAEMLSELDACLKAAPGRIGSFCQSHRAKSRSAQSRWRRTGLLAWMGGG